MFSGPDTYPGKVAGALQVDAFALIKAFCKPRIKVGTEWVIKGQTCEQSTNATAGIARAIYDRLFKFLIEVRIVISNLFFSTTASSRK